MGKKEQGWFRPSFLLFPFFLKERFRLRPLLWSTTTLDKLISYVLQEGSIGLLSTSSPFFTTPHPRF
jgi:hypothetical protein